MKNILTEKELNEVAGGRIIKILPKPIPDGALYEPKADENGSASRPSFCGKKERWLFGRPI